MQGVVTIQVKPLSLPHHSSRPLPAQLDVMEVERSFSSGMQVHVEQQQPEAEGKGEGVAWSSSPADVQIETQVQGCHVVSMYTIADMAGSLHAGSPTCLKTVLLVESGCVCICKWL